MEKRKDISLDPIEESSMSPRTAAQLEMLRSSVTEVESVATNFQEMLKALMAAEKNPPEMDGNDEKRRLLSDTLGLCASSVNAAHAELEASDENSEAKKAADSARDILAESLLSNARCLFSKTMVYPCFKRMNENFPAYMESHRSELSNETRARYEQQMKVIATICAEYEDDIFDDPSAPVEEVNNRLGKIVLLIMSSQMCGFPPEEVAGKLPEGWKLNASTNSPQIEEAKSAAENCSVM